MDASKQFCPNLACSARGQIGQGNIRIHDHNRQRYRCRRCKQTFSARRGTMLEGLRKPTELIVIVVTLLAYGCPTQALVHAFGLDKRTVTSWRDRAGRHRHQVHQAFVPQGQLDTQHVQIDEIRVKGRQMIAWMGLALMVPTRLWLGGVVSAHRDRSLADRLLHHVRACCRPLPAILMCTDGWAAYVRRVGVYEIPVRHGRGREQEPLGQELTRRGNSKGTVACS
jgi:transposase-like protein